MEDSHNAHAANQTSGGERTTGISDLSKRAYKLLRDSRTDRAIELFREILESEPENHYALVGLGDSLRKEKRFEEALGYYEECLRSHPGNNYALFGLADCQKSLGDFEKAIETWEEYLHHDQSNVTVLTRIADAYRKIHKYEKSVEIYEKVLEIDDDNAYALIGLGHLHYDFKEYSKALDQWKRMEGIYGEKTDIRVLTSIGNCYRKLKEFEKGIPYFKRALKKQPRNFYALFGMADCHRGLFDTEESLVYWNRILEHDPKNKVILTRAGDAYRILKDWDTAVECYRKALGIDFDIYAAMGMALVDKAKGQTDQALAALVDLVREDPRNDRLVLETAACYEELGRKDEAIAILEKYLRFGVPNEKIEDFIKSLKKG